MLRPVDLTRLREELRRMRRLNEELGVPLLDDYFRRILQEGWLTRNPELFHLYEVEGELRGYTGLFPIYPESYRDFIEGERFPFRHIRPDDILTGAEYVQARLTGAWIWMESFMGADQSIRQALGEYVYHYLSSLHLKGLLITTSAPQGEEDCRWLGMTLLREDERCPTGVRKLWYADETIVAPTAGEPFGPPTPIRCLFLTVQERFGQPPRSLELSPTERRVARLFYLEDRKADEIARVLSMKPGTVKTYLQRIRTKAEPIVCSRLSRRIAAYLLQHPGEVVESEGEAR